MNENIPKVVLDAAKGLIGQYGQNFKKLGLYNGQEAYMYQFPENSFTGFPFVFLYNVESNIVVGVKGFEALDIISSFN